MNEVTRILSALGEGDPQAASRLLPLVYDELRKLAAQRLAHEAPGQTLEPTALGMLNRWRNVAAHHATTLPPGGPLTLPRIQAWRTSCDGLATSLDDIMYNVLLRTLRRSPW